MTTGLATGQGRGKKGGPGDQAGTKDKLGNQAGTGTGSMTR